jgi:hypothetical protein
MALTEKRKSDARAFYKKHIKRLRKKYRILGFAHHKVKYALETGKMEKSYDCEMCKTKGTYTVGHHFDYNKPLEVIWVCRKCHKKIHSTYPDYCKVENCSGKYYCKGLCKVHYSALDRITHREEYSKYKKIWYQKKKLRFVEASK